MGELTKIEWADESWDPWMGRGKGSPISPRADANWAKPAQWNAQNFCECTGCGWRGTQTSWDARGCRCGAERTKSPAAARRRVTAIGTDWLDDRAPIEWLVDLLDLIRRTPDQSRGKPRPPARGRIALAA